MGAVNGAVLLLLVVWFVIVLGEVIAGSPTWDEVQ